MKPRKLPFQKITQIEEQRFWAKVSKGKMDECWPWTGCLVRSGYGMLTIRRNQWLATRIGWFMVHKTDPYPLLVLHTCDNRKCCNPSHWFLGTDLDNAKDRDGKRRQPTKITKEQAEEIRILIGCGLSQRKIAARFGLSQQTISNINLRQIWR